MASAAPPGFFIPVPSPLYSMQERDFSRVICEAGTSLEFKGKTIPCTFAAADNDFALAPDGGGEMRVYDLIATALKCSFSGLGIPQKSDVIEAEGMPYQVGKTQARPGSPLVKIYCANLDL